MADEKFIFDLKILYGKNENIDNILSSALTSSCLSIYELQEKIVDLILNDELISKYPTSVKYQKKFLKTLITAIEKLNEEVHPTILNNYIELINGKAADDTYYRIYYSNVNKKPIIMEQYEAVISNGTTGCHIWPAAMKLIDFLEKNVELFDDKVILELGAGVGLVGLYCLRDSKPKSYLFTDHHDLVLKQLERNIHLNHENLRLNNENINILRLDWININGFNVDFPIDIILASDVIFDPEIVPYLVNTIDYLISKAIEHGNSNAHAYISSAIRNQDTYNLFLKYLDKHGLQYKLIEKVDSTDEKSIKSIEILKIFK